MNRLPHHLSKYVSKLGILFALLFGVVLFSYNIGLAKLTTTSSAPIIGVGTFGAPATVTSDAGPASVAIGDFNNDGRSDMAVANQAANNVAILVGNGDATFKAPIKLSAGTSPRAVAIGDFDKDGKQDFAVANFGNSADTSTKGTVTVFINNGNDANGTPNFKPGVNYTVGVHPRALLAVALFGPGSNIDLVTANADSGNVSVLEGLGDGTFFTIFGQSINFPAANPNAASSHPIGLTSGDFNGDGRIDLAVADRDGNSVNLLIRPNSDGSLQFKAPIPLSTGDTGAFWVTTDDFNVDGKLDLAVVHVFPGAGNLSRMSVLLNSGNDTSINPTFQAPALYTIGTNTTPQSIAASDFNGDGRSDLAVANFGGTVSVFLNAGDGTFQNAVAYSAGVSPEYVAIGDLNRDGVLDLAVADQATASTTVNVLLGNTQPGKSRVNSKIAFQRGFGASIDDPFNRGGQLYKTDPAIPVNQTTGQGENSVLFGAGSQPSYSIDGSKLAYIDNIKLFITDSTDYSKSKGLLIPQGGSPITALYPKISPDNSQVAYQGFASVNSTSVYKIVVVNAACTSGNENNVAICNSTTLAFNFGDTTNNMYPVWFPMLTAVGGGNHSGRIAFVRTASKTVTTGDIFATDLRVTSNGKIIEDNTINLTNNPGNYAYLAYSPDGRYISFTKDGGLWVMNADGTNAQQILHTSPNNNVAPLNGNRMTWSPDGTQIAFDFDSRIWKADISVTPTAAASATNVSFLSLLQADGDEFASWEPGAIAVPTPSPSPSPSPTPNASITFDGRLRDRVGHSEAGIFPDGESDGTFTMTLPLGSASKIITAVDLKGPNGNRWDTIPGNGLWVVGIADGLDTQLLNNADGTVNFQAGNGTLKLFVPDSNPSSFVQGSKFDLTVTFGDGSSYVASTIATQTPFVDLGINMVGPATGKASAIEIIRYGVSIQNFGNQLANNVHFRNPLSAAVKLISLEPTNLCDQSGISTFGATIKCDFSTFPAGSAKSVVIQVQDTATETLHMNGTVTADQSDVAPDPHPNTASVNTDIVKPVDLSVSIDAPSQVNTTDDINYTIKVTNNTTGADAHSVTLTDVIPNGATFVSVTPPLSGNVNCSQNGNSITCTLAVVESKISYGINLKVHPLQGGTITNTASVSSMTPDPNLLNNTASASTRVLIGSDVSVTMSAPAQVGDDQNLTYAIRITNNGPATASQVVVGDQLPSNTTFVSVSPGPQANSPKCDLNLFPKDPSDPDSVQCLMGTMANGTTLQVNLTVKPKNQSGNISNSVVAFPVFENVSDAIPSNNNATANTVACMSGNSAVPTFQTSSPQVTAAGVKYTYIVRAIDARGSRISYTLGQGPTDMTLTNLSDGSARVEWTPPVQLKGQAVPVSIVASNGSCNGTLAQSFSINVTDAPPPGGYKLTVGNMTISSSSMVKISNGSPSKSNHRINANDPLDGTYKLGGDTKINDYLHFEGDITVTVNKAAATFDVVVSQGKLEITSIPIYGNYTLWQGGGLSFHLDGNGQLTNFLQTNVQKPLNIAGVNVAIDSARLVLQNDLGVVLAGRLVFDNVAGIKGLSAQFTELSITQKTGIRFSSDIVVPDFNIGGFGVKKVHLQWIAGATPMQDVFRGSGQLTTPAFQVAGSIEFIAGRLNSVQASVAVGGTGLPIPPFFNITGANIGVQNLQAGPFTIFIKCDITLANPAMANIIKLSNAGVTYTAPGKLDISSDLDIFSARAANAILGADLPYSFKIGAGVTLVDDFPVFLAQAALAAGARDDGTGHLSFFIEGSADAKIQIPDESDFTRNFSWVYKILKANPGPNLKFPLTVATANVSFGFPPGKFSYSTSLPILGQVTAAAERVQNGVLAQVATNYGNLPVTIPLGAHAVTDSTDKSSLSMGPRRVSSTTEGVYVPATNVLTPQSLGTVAVSATAPNVVFQVNAVGGAPRYDLIKPDSTRVTPENATSNNAVFIQNLDSADSFYVVTNPVTGVWSIEAEDGTQGPFVITVHGGNASPVMNSVNASPNGSSVQINYDATDVDDNATVSLFYDTNPSTFQGQLIAKDLQKGSGNYSWNTGDGSVPSGDYYVYASIDDGKNMPQRKYAATKISVVDPTAPAVPANVVVNGTGENSLVVSWTPNTEPNLRGYVIHYAIDHGVDTALIESFDAGNKTSVRLPALANLTTYRVSVAAYNQTETPDPSDSTKTLISNRTSGPSSPLTATTGVAVPPVVQLTSPNGGETVPGDNDLNISWTVAQDGDIANQSIEVSIDGGITYSPLHLSLDGDTRNFLWHIPAAIQTSNARFKVSATDTSGNTSVDISDADFIIQPAATPTPTPTPSPTPALNTMEFGAATYTTAENGGAVNITVTRTGDTTSASTVDYVTSDGSAHQSSDYEKASSTLNFAAGETQHTLTVLINSDYYVEADESFNLSLSNPTGGGLGAQSTTTVTITDSTISSFAQNAKVFVADLNNLQEVPATTSSARAAAIVQLSSDETSARISLTITTALSGTETTATINGPAAPGSTGPVLFTLPGGSYLNFDITLTATQVTQLKNGQLYINLSSSAATAGEIRGQLLVNTMDDAQSFVLQNYYDFLSRVPDSEGFAFWTKQITDAGTDPLQLRNKRVDVSNAFYFEPEFQQTGGYVFRLYRSAYGNNQPSPNPDTSNLIEAKKLPAYSAFSSDRARVIGGLDLPSGQLALASAFTTRPEFTARYAPSLDGPGFVDAILLTIKNDLGIDLASQRDPLIALYSSGGRAAVLYRLADDNSQTNPINNRALIDGEYNRVFVATQYFGYLRRDPDIGGFLFWLNQVNGAPLRDIPKQHALVCSFLTAAEYQLRFSPVVSRFNSECPQ